MTHPSSEHSDWTNWAFWLDAQMNVATFPPFVYFISFVSKWCVPCKKTLDTKNLQLLSTENVKSCTLTALSLYSFEHCLVGAPYYGLSTSPFEVVWMMPLFSIVSASTTPLFFFLCFVFHVNMSDDSYLPSIGERNARAGPSHRMLCPSLRRS